MKNTYSQDRLRKRLLFTVVFMLGFLECYAQVGNTISNPIVAGTFNTVFEYSDSRNTENYTDNYSGVGIPTNDVYHQFTLSCPMQVRINHCGSTLSDTYVFLLDSNGWEINSNDDDESGNCSHYYHSFLEVILNTGIYYIVSEGYRSNGIILTTITGEPVGNTINNPIQVGRYSGDFVYSNSQNTNDFTNNYSGLSGNDVFYDIELLKDMIITVDHCGSEVEDTYLHLLDFSGKRIDFDDDDDNENCWCSNGYLASIRKILPAGRYYIVSEGYENGVICTNIKAEEIPIGNSLAQPISVGTFSSNFQYTDSKNTSEFTNDFGERHNEVFYKFSLVKTMEMTINHCGSEVDDTYLYILNESGSLIAYNDDYYGSDGCGRNSFIKKILPAGTYYVVSEGNFENGVIKTNIQGKMDFSGNTMQNPIVIETFNASFTYNNSQNTAYFGNEHTLRSPNDIFYKFTLSETMEIIISHCGSGLNDTYLHLLDASGTRVDYNDDSVEGLQCDNSYQSYLKRFLNAGTYYIVSEGYSASDNGEILTTVTGLPTNLEYVYDASGNRIGRIVPATIMTLNSVIEKPQKEKTNKPEIDTEDKSIYLDRIWQFSEAKKQNNKVRKTAQLFSPHIDANTGIMAEIEVSIAPNPTKGELIVNVMGYDGQLGGEIWLFDSTGKILSKYQIESEYTKLDLAGYLEGIYLLQIKLNGQAVMSHKVIKE